MNASIIASTNSAKSSAASAASATKPSMNQPLFGLLLFVFLVLPPVAHFMESVMIIHMHMQMPLLVIAGCLMGRAVQIKFSPFLAKWNEGGIPGILLFTIITVLWMVPRMMDEALASQGTEWFKFVSLALLAGVPLRVSWGQLSFAWKNAILIGFTGMFALMGWLYVKVPIQLCNNYLLIEQITLGWAFVTMAVCLAIYTVYQARAEQGAVSSNTSKGR
jgi:hypothetical protein